MRTLRYGLTHMPVIHLHIVLPPRRRRAAMDAASYADGIRIVYIYIFVFVYVIHCPATTKAASGDGGVSYADGIHCIRIVYIYKIYIYIRIYGIYCPATTKCGDGGGFMHGRYTLYKYCVCVCVCVYLYTYIRYTFTKCGDAGGFIRGRYPWRILESLLFSDFM